MDRRKQIMSGNKANEKFAVELLSKKIVSLQKIVRTILKQAKCLSNGYGR